MAYSDAMMPSLQLAKSSRLARRIAVVLLVLLAATILLMFFAPWQQTITGGGYVIAYAPRERQQGTARGRHRHEVRVDTRGNAATGPVG